ncbi:MAG: ferrous iron transport protein A [Acidobacteria bacterium]|nr:MAG: ferrous iron transport protein A [Acidobacteriota bacterium]REK08859.1 MAG: ferrous iron transport protein A [Acidobacteriota bacterium]
MSDPTTTARLRSTAADRPGPGGASPSTLAELEVGAKARVIDFRDRDDRSVQRLMHLGLLVGIEIEMVRRAPAGDPLEIRLLGFALSLRRREARLVLVETSSG